MYCVEAHPQVLEGGVTALAVQAGLAPAVAAANLTGAAAGAGHP